MKAAERLAVTGLAVVTLLLGDISATRSDQGKPRARDLGILLDGTPGPLDAITDVGGVEVGHTTLIAGEGRLVVGQGPVRTGVTAILPRGKQSLDPVFAGWFSLNGNGEMTGTTWIEESGFLEGPIMITNTHSVGIVRDAVVEWTAARNPDLIFTLPVVAETADALLNDMNGFHVHREDALAALDSATAGPVAEGNVGGGTGMICHEFKGGIGTASRVVPSDFGGYTVGVLAQCNSGTRRELRIDGVPVGRLIPDLHWCYEADEPPARAWVRSVVPRCGEASAGAEPNPLAGMGSIIIVVATDAPLLPHQLKRLARRAALGLGMVGGQGENGSGDLMIAFSTANPGAWEPRVTTLTMFPNQWMDVLFTATIEATEESIVNAMLAAETMTGVDGIRVFALPHDRLLDGLRRYNRLAPNQ